jgi:hypothetical protein
MTRANLLSMRSFRHGAESSRVVYASYLPRRILVDHFATGL